VIDAARYTLLIYGILMIVGGILGYKLPKKPSKISLIAGCASGALAIVSFLIATFEESATSGLAIGLVVAVGVGVMMLPRLKKAEKPTSAGVIIALSGLVAIVVVAALVMSP